MIEIQHYDKAAHNFYSKQSVNSFPLLAWDLFVEQFKTTSEGLNDAVKFKKIAAFNKWSSTIPFKDEILVKNHVIVVTDSNLNIVYSSKNIKKMNGYTPEEIIGKNPKMFQGKHTCKKTAFKIGQAIKNRTPFEETILNYRKDGTTYNCWIKGTPIKDIKGNVVNFIAFEKEVA